MTSGCCSTTIAEIASRTRLSLSGTWLAGGASPRPAFWGRDTDRTETTGAVGTEEEDVMSCRSRDRQYVVHPGAAVSVAGRGRFPVLR